MIEPSFTFCLCATLGYQFGNKITVLRDAPRYNGLRRLNRLLRRPQAQLALTDSLDQQVVSGFQTGRGSAFRRDHDAPLLIDSCPRCHDPFRPN